MRRFACRYFQISNQLNSKLSYTPCYTQYFLKINIFINKKIMSKDIREMIDKVRNIKNVKITVPNKEILKRLNSTPTFNILSRLKLQVGENIENVNHAQFADMVRLYPLIGVTVEEVV
jgi:hypothetical protein